MQSIIQHANQMKIYKHKWQELQENEVLDASNLF
jgi:hypothetical protein